MTIGLRSTGIVKLDQELDMFSNERGPGGPFFSRHGFEFCPSKFDKDLVYRVTISSPDRTYVNCGGDDWIELLSLEICLFILKNTIFHCLTTSTL